MSIALQLPTLPDPQQVVVYLALHVGLPAAAVGIIAWLVGLYQSAKGWADSLTSVRDSFQRTSIAFQRVIEERKRAAALLGLYSALAVGLSYMLALLINALIIIYKSNQNGITSWSAVESTMSGAKWPPAASWTVGIEAAAICLYLLAMSADLKVLRGLITFAISVAAFACAMATIGMVFDLIGEWMTPANQNLGNNRKALIETQIFIAVVCTALIPLLIGVISAAGRAFKSTRY
jgi:hypothetical protein